MHETLRLLELADLPQCIFEEDGASPRILKKIDHETRTAGAVALQAVGPRTCNKMWVRIIVIALS